MACLPTSGIAKVRIRKILIHSIAPLADNFISRNPIELLSLVTGSVAPPPVRRQVETVLLQESRDEIDRLFMGKHGA